jgi:hypothetical protein
MQNPSIKFLNIAMSCLRKQYLLCYLFLKFLLLVSCHDIYRGDEIEQLQIIYSYPIISEEKKLHNLYDTVNVYKHKGAVFYEAAYQEINVDSRFNSTLAKKNMLFAHWPGDKYGYIYYNVLEPKHREKANADSLLSKIALKTNLQLVADSMLRIFDSTSSNYRIQKYVFSGVVPAESFDTVVLYYNKGMKGVPYTFTAELDSVSDSKLFKVEFKFNRKWSDENKFLFPERILSYEMVATNRTLLDSLSYFIRAFGQGYSNERSNRDTNHQ